MSLDVYLEGPEETVECECNNCWTKHTRVRRPMYYSANITHNLNRMAQEAGIYTYLWRPEEIGITKAHELIRPLTAGLERLKARPGYFESFNSPNGWGIYKHFVPFVEAYLQACMEYPDALVSVSR